MFKSTIGREKILGGLAIAIISICAVFWLLSLSQKQSTPPQAVPLAVSRIAAPQSTENFLIAQATGNATLGWDSLALDYQKTLTAAGHDKDYLQVSFARATAELRSYQYIAGTTIDDGTSIHFYVLTLADKNGKLERLPVNFTLDKNNKIIAAAHPALKD